jgi:predicted DsbA family dithiol-disulfide isomerase
MITLDVWSDVVCPWCWIGEHRLQRALEGLKLEAQWRFHAYELGARVQKRQPVIEHLARKYRVSLEEAKQMSSRVHDLAAELGLAIHTEREATAATFDAHRLIQGWQAKTGDARALMDRLHKAHFDEGLDVSDKAVLRRLAVEAGVESGEAERILSTDAYTLEVEEGEQRARDYEIRGVPFVAINGRWAVGGAQPIELFQKALKQALEPA